MDVVVATPPPPPPSPVPPPLVREAAVRAVARFRTAGSDGRSPHFVNDLVHKLSVGFGKPVTIESVRWAPLFHMRLRIGTALVRVEEDDRRLFTAFVEGNYVPPVRFQPVRVLECVPVRFRTSADVFLHWPTAAREEEEPRWRAGHQTTTLEVASYLSETALFHAVHQLLSRKRM